MLIDPFSLPPSQITCDGCMHDRERGLKQLCFGWYRQKISYASKEYSVQPLKDSGLEGAQWYIDPVEGPGKQHLVGTTLYIVATVMNTVEPQRPG